MQAVMERQAVESVGEYITLKEGARRKGCTWNALYLYVKLYNVPRVYVGRSLLVKPEDIVGYVPRGKRGLDA